MSASEAATEGARQAFVIFPARATAVAPYLSPGATVSFLGSAEEADSLSTVSGGCIAFHDAETMVALLQRRDLSITKVITADDSAVAFFTQGGSAPAIFTAEEVIAILNAVSDDTQTSVEYDPPAVPSFKDAEVTALRREMATLREENRRHRARLTKIKRHPVGKLALRVNRMLRTSRK